MNNYRYKLFFRILWVVLFAALTGFVLFFRLYALSVLCFFVVCLFAHSLFLFQSRTVKDMKRLIEAIRFSEFNISFRNFTKKGLASELVPDMENAIDCFNRKQRKMVSEQSFYEILLNRIDFGILIIDRHKNIVWINMAALDVLGKPKPKHLSDLKSVSPDLPSILAALYSRETKIIRLERDRKTHQLAVGSVSFFVEEKELKLISLKNIQSVLEESESDAWKKLIRVLTHEIMNSLSPIISLSETFSEPDEENRELLTRAMQVIHRRSKGLVDFVNNYKKLTHIPQPFITRFPAKDWIEDVYRLMSVDGFAFSYTVQPQDMRITADRSLMEQVLINLIKNACESVLSGKPVFVRVDISRNEVHRPLIRVTDNGEGILPEVMDKIFVPFFSTKTAGSGIGLSICRQIVVMHGGTISARSEPDKGSCFTIVL